MARPCPGGRAVSLSGGWACRPVCGGGPRCLRHSLSRAWKRRHAGRAGVSELRPVPLRPGLLARTETLLSRASDSLTSAAVVLLESRMSAWGVDSAASHRQTSPEHGDAEVAADPAVAAVLGFLSIS